ncbi:MAG: LysR substrate-binding domain-containing protein [Leptospirales bacterium]
MTNDQLKVFLKVAEHQSFTQAGEALFLTQPAISLQVKSLEKDLGVPLFERTGKKVLLTEAGRKLLPLARSIIRQMEEAREAVLPLGDTPQGHLRLGASMTIGTYLLPRLLAGFRKAHPRITASLAVQNTHQILHDLKSSEIDLGLIEGEPTKTQGLSLDRTFLDHDHLVLIDSASHPLAPETGSSSLSLLRKLPFIGREPGSGTRQVIERELLEKGLPPDYFDVVMTVDNPEAIKELVALGAGLAFISSLCLNPEEADRIRTVPVEGFAPVRNLWIFVPQKKLSPPADLFLGLLVKTRGSA